MLEEIHQKLVNNKNEIDKWFLNKLENIEMPIYASVDVRYSGWKVSVVDANYFPAGFNNISGELIPTLPSSFKEYLEMSSKEVSHVHIFPESHTRNTAYVENLLRLREVIGKAGFKVTVGSPELNGYTLLEGITEDLELNHVSINEEDILEIDGIVPDLIVLNNDLTGGLIKGLSGLVLPPKEMGWHKRRKSNHYLILEKLVSEVSEILKIDPWLLMPIWFVSEDKCLEFDKCINKLSNDIDTMIERIKIKYSHFGIDSEPVVFIKNDRGTYGLGIISIKSGKEIKNLSKRMVKRLTYGKGGTSAENFLIQEGIPTSLISDSSVIEPVGYTIGGRESFWFFRSNSKKNKFENLNSPSSLFLQKNQLAKGIVDEKRMNLFDFISKLSFLAMGIESIQK
jgi:glutamate--cysteine ligase